MSTNYTGNATASEAPSPVPAAGAVPIVVLPASGDALTAASVAQMAKVPADWSAWLALQVFNSAGDGSDGALAFDGSTTILGMVPSSSIYTMTRDIFATNITFTNSAKLVQAGNRLYVRGTIDATASAVSGGGIINTDGAAGGNGGLSSSGIGGVAGATNILLSGAAGGNGGAAGVGSAGSNSTPNSIGSNGGDGCIGGFGAGAGGSVGPISAILGSPRLASPPTLGMVVGNSSGSGAVTLPRGGAGGGGGGSSSTDSGGGGGAGGGITVVMARTLKLKTAGDIRAGGGNGGNGHVGTFTGAGGGGGGGGAAIIVYGSYTTQDASTFSDANNCPGGIKGSGGGSGLNGTNGHCFAIAAGGF